MSKQEFDRLEAEYEGVCQAGNSLDNFISDEYSDQCGYGSGCESM